MGHGRCLATSSIAVVEHLLVRPRIHKSDELFLQRVHHAVFSGKGTVVLRAPPVEFTPAATPVAPIPLSNAHQGVTTRERDLLFSKRYLPADVGFQGNVAFAAVEGQDVQGTTGPAVKVGTIEENTGVLDQFGDEFATLRCSGRSAAALVLELPLVGGESCCGEFDSLAIILVGEVCAVAATPLDQFGCGAGQHALAAIAKDAGPVTD